jgi:hypothetical protein
MKTSIKWKKTWSYHTKNFISIQWNRKKNTQISWDYPFNTVQLAKTSIKGRNEMKQFKEMYPSTVHDIIDTAGMVSLVYRKGHRGHLFRSATYIVLWSKLVANWHER